MLEMSDKEALGGLEIGGSTGRVFALGNWMQVENSSLATGRMNMFSFFLGKYP